MLEASWFMQKKKRKEKEGKVRIIVRLCRPPKAATKERGKRKEMLKSCLYMIQVFQKTLGRIKSRSKRYLNRKKDKERKGAVKTVDNPVK